VGGGIERGVVRESVVSGGSPPILQFWIYGSTRKTGIVIASQIGPARRRRDETYLVLHRREPMEE